MATETLTAPYSHDTFHTAVDISVAGKEFLTRDGKKFVEETLAPLVKRHGLEGDFGVCLIHRHFDIDPNEKLVEFNNITLPLTINVGLNEFAGKEDHLIYDTAWMLDSNGKWMAYEYSFSLTRGKDSYIVNIQDVKYRDFLVEFTAAVTAGGWETILGLRAWPGPGFQGVLEITQGKANYNLAPQQHLLDEDSVMKF